MCPKSYTNTGVSKPDVSQQSQESRTNSKSYHIQTLNHIQTHGSANQMSSYVAAVARVADKLKDKHNVSKSRWQTQTQNTNINVSKPDVQLCDGSAHGARKRWRTRSRPGPQVDCTWCFFLCICLYSFLLGSWCRSVALVVSCRHSGCPCALVSGRTWLLYYNDGTYTHAHYHTFRTLAIVFQYRTLFREKNFKKQNYCQYIGNSFPVPHTL